MFAGLQSYISALGLGVQNSELGLGANLYHRVVVMTDAPVDGARLDLPPFFIFIFPVRKISILYSHIRRVG